MYLGIIFTTCHLLHCYQLLRDVVVYVLFYVFFFFADSLNQLIGPFQVWNSDRFGSLGSFSATVEMFMLLSAGSVRS